MVFLTKREHGRLKCRFCDWQIPRFTTSKRGKITNRYQTLLSHVMLEHEEEYKKITGEGEDGNYIQ